MSTVLALDTGFQPTAVIPWQRAITLWWEKKVEIIESYDRTIRSINFEMKVPSVVRFLQGPSIRKKAIKFSRENVYQRDNYSCQYCGKRVARHELTYDHVLPRSQGGLTNWMNVVTCCIPCNQKKGGRTPEQARMVLLSVPVKPKKLSDKVRFCLSMPENSIPETWRGWLRDVTYWQGSLEEDK
jgi:5-methylcytosine-specific restriction endonuclease McrA